MASGAGRSGRNRQGFPRLIRGCPDVIARQVDVLPAEWREVRQQLLYAWLAQRLHRVDARKPAFIGWASLRDQFGWHYNQVRKFRQVFLDTLRQVRAVYPAARVGEEISHTGQPEGLILYNSFAPVAKCTVSGC